MGARWTATEQALFATLPDSEVAKATKRPLAAVVKQRLKLGLKPIKREYKKRKCLDCTSTFSPTGTRDQRCHPCALLVFKTKKRKLDKKYKTKLKTRKLTPTEIATRRKKRREKYYKESKSPEFRAKESAKSAAYYKKNREKILAKRRRELTASRSEKERDQLSKLLKKQNGNNTTNR